MWRFPKYLMDNTAVMTDLEEIVVRWLDRHQIDYQFQSSLMGGYYELGGSVVDILLPSRGLAFRVQGEYWHQRVGQQGRDMVQKELLSGLGWTVIDLWGDDIQSRLNETMRRALLGQEMLH